MRAMKAMKAVRRLGLRGWGLREGDKEDGRMGSENENDIAEGGGLEKGELEEKRLEVRRWAINIVEYKKRQ